MAQATYPEYETVLDELAKTIRTYRSICLPRETARRLLEYDSPGNTALVGINYDATHAVLHHERDRYVIAVEFGPDGPESGGPKLAQFDFGTNVYAWTRRMDAYWSWLHLRFR